MSTPTLEDLAARIRTAVASPIHVGTTMDAGYSDMSADHVPAVWVGAMQSNPVGEDIGYTGLLRRKMAVSWAVRVHVGRADQAASAEPELLAIAAAIDSVMLGWYPPHCDMPTLPGGFFDEMPGYSSVSRVLRYASQVTTQVPG